MVIGMRRPSIPPKFARSNYFQGSLCQLVCYSILSPAPPFPVMVLAFCIVGFGMALQVRCFAVVQIFCCAEFGKL